MVGLGVSALAANSLAAVGMYYSDAYVDSRWVDVTSAVETQHYGDAWGDTYGSTSTPSFYAGTYTFSASSQSAASPQSIVGTGGYATANSLLDFQFSSSGFTVKGGGTSTGLRGSDATASSITADLLASLSFNFMAPLDDVSYDMTITGTTTASARTTLFLRISEVTDTSSTDFVYVNRTTSNTLANSQTINVAATLTPGSYYSFDLYALPAVTVTGAQPGPFSRTSEVDVTTTFTAIPEPTALTVIAGGSVLTMRRKRERVVR